MKRVELTGENALTADEAKALSLCVGFAAIKSDWGRWNLWQQAATGKAKVDAARTQPTSPPQDTGGDR